VIDEYQRHSALVVAIAAWELAQLPDPLPRANILPLPPRRLGVALDGVRVVEVLAGSLAEQRGVASGDRIRAIDGIVVVSAGELSAALQAGGPDKRVELERAGAGERLELSFDFRLDPDEAGREARRVERRARFGPELLPFDDEADGEKTPSRDE